MFELIFELLLLQFIHCWCNETTFDCPMRQLALEFAQEIQPWLSYTQLQDIADALNGSPEAQMCQVTPAILHKSPKLSSIATHHAPVWNDINIDMNIKDTMQSPSIPSSVADNIDMENSDLKHVHTQKRRMQKNYQNSNDNNHNNRNYLFVDFINGNDLNDGSSIDTPLKHLATAIDKNREKFGSKNDKTIILREGRHYLSNTIYLDKNDANLLITNYNNEHAEISGALPLNNNNCDWKFWKQGNNSNSNNNNSFKNYYFCQIKNTSIVDFSGLRINGERGIRARYPNAIPEIDGFGSNLTALEWFASNLSREADILINSYNYSYPVRNDSAGFDTYYKMPYFWYFMLGIGDICRNFNPNQGYWCGHPQGGFMGVPYYTMTDGFRFNASTLPNTPYNISKAKKRGIVQVWHPAHWSTWMFEIGNIDFNYYNMSDDDYDSYYNYGNYENYGNDYSSNSTGWIKFDRGGFQGARGNNVGGEFWIDNIFEELDYPNEWYFDFDNKILYYYNNFSTIHPNNLTFEYTNLKTLFYCNNTQNITIRGVTIRDTSKTFMDDHAMPSGGDWALQRIGVIYIENSDNISIHDSLFTRNDGIAVSINKYARDINIYKNEIIWNGATAIALWGDTFINDSDINNYNINISDLVSYGWGWDGTLGTQPRFINVSYNLVHELGIWEKQSSFYFQAKSCNNYIYGNIFYNGPRAGINFNDGFGGGSKLMKNLLFNTCRESGDHGPFNSWDRQVYVTRNNDELNNVRSTIKAYDHITQNFIIANYHSSMAIDNDDNSCYYKTYKNFLVYSPCGMKNNFGGHDNHHFGNIYGYISTCFQSDQDMRSGQLAEHNDYFYNNTCVLKERVPGTYGQWNCSYTTDRWPVLGNNSIHTTANDDDGSIDDERLYSFGGNVNNVTGLCDVNEETFQKKYNMDIGTKILGSIPDDVLLNQAKDMLWK